MITAFSMLTNGGLRGGQTFLREITSEGIP